MSFATLSRNRIAHVTTTDRMKGERGPETGHRIKPEPRSELKRRSDDHVSEETRVYRQLAKTLGVPFVSFPVLLQPTISPADAMRAGLAPTDARRYAPSVDMPVFIYAPEGDALAELAYCGVPAFNRSGVHLAVTTPRVFRRSIRATFGDMIARAATYSLPRKLKVASALSLSCHIWVAVLTGFGAVMLASVMWSSAFWNMILLLLTCFPVLPGLVIKIMALQSAKEGDGFAPPLADRDLPTYSVLVPVFKEAAILPQLVRSLSALDYPQTKLDIKLLIEADDTDTLGALDLLILPDWFDVVICPRGEPRTKPRALQIGLAYTKSELIVVYDAEDIPEPDQLKKAAAIFKTAHPALACLQARLTIDNLDDGWLTRQFALEYAALFDVLLPGLAQLNQPIPLGGTSNHFRRQALVDVGAWDPWNVTEDADLGLRLFRAGYEVKALNSTTHEEAPAHLGGWTNQRTRWLKGWMQTAAVHFRSHGRDRDRMTPSRYMMLILAASLSPLTILFHPALLLGLDVLIDQISGSANESLIDTLLTGFFFAMLFACGFFDMHILARGARERKIRITAMTLIGTIPYSCLKTFAAWRALFELLYAPHYWRKTDHGCARTSRLIHERAIKTAF